MSGVLGNVRITKGDVKFLLPSSVYTDMYTLVMYTLVMYTQVVYTLVMYTLMMYTLVMNTPVMCHNNNP